MVHILHTYPATLSIPLLGKVYPLSISTNTTHLRYGVNTEDILLHYLKCAIDMDHKKTGEALQFLEKNLPAELFQQMVNTPMKNCPSTFIQYAAKLCNTPCVTTLIPYTLFPDLVTAIYEGNLKKISELHKNFPAEFKQCLTFKNKNGNTLMEVFDLQLNHYVDREAYEKYSLHFFSSTFDEKPSQNQYWQHLQLKVRLEAFPHVKPFPLFTASAYSPSSSHSIEEIADYFHKAFPQKEDVVVSYRKIV